MSLANSQISGYLQTPKALENTSTLSISYRYSPVRALPLAEGVNSESKYPGKPIFWYYKISKNLDGTISETRIDNNEYWKPIENETAYRIYSAGDEFVTQKALSAPAYGFNKWLAGDGITLKFPYGEILDFGNKQYRCTGRTINWKFIADKEYMGRAYKKFANPYSYDEIQIWTRMPNDPEYSFTYPNGLVSIAFYWFNPKTKAFYPLPDSYGFVGLMNDASATSFVDFSLSILGVKKSDKTTLVNTQFSELINITKNIIPPDQINFRNSIFDALVSYYVETFGVSTETAENAIAEAYGKKKSTQTVNLGGGKGSGATDNGTTSSLNSQPIKVAVNKSTANGGNTEYGDNDANRPQIVQQYKLPGYSESITRRYIFMLRPNNISYSNIGSEWVDIPRSGTSPLVDWKAHKLMQVAFQFVIVPDREGSLDNRRGASSVININIDDQIRVLNEMASTPYPVILLGFDKMLKNETRYPFEDGRGVEFVITDFSVSSLFRSEDGGINRAECEITLREIPIDSVTYIDFPSLRFPKEKSAPKPKKGSDNTGGKKLSDTSATLAQFVLDPTKTSARTGIITGS